MADNIKISSYIMSIIGLVLLSIVTMPDLQIAILGNLYAIYGMLFVTVIGIIYNIVFRGDAWKHTAISSLIMAIIGALLLAILNDNTLLQVIMGNYFAEYGLVVLVFLSAIYNVIFAGTSESSDEDAAAE